jgi:hypothetical protein
MPKTYHLALLAAFLSSCGCAVRAEAETRKVHCETMAPISSVRGYAWYSDSSGSVVDHQALAIHLKEIEPLRNYATHLVQLADKGEWSCMHQNLLRWAKADALGRQPENFAGVRERMRFTTAINIAALRLRRHMELQQEILTWLEGVNSKVAADFGRRNIGDNLNVWSGATAALGHLLTSSSYLAAHSDAVWRRGISSIELNGRVASEARRHSRALLYHSYFLSGLLMLQRAREASKLQTPPNELAAIQRLTQLVQTGSCNAEAFAATIGIMTPQEKPSLPDLATLEAFAGESLQALRLCSHARIRLYQPLLGGDLRRIKDLLESERAR